MARWIDAKFDRPLKHVHTHGRAKLETVLVMRTVIANWDIGGWGMARMLLSLMGRTDAEMFAMTEDDVRTVVAAEGPAFLRRMGREVHRAFGGGERCELPSIVLEPLFRDQIRELAERACIELRGASPTPEWIEGKGRKLRMDGTLCGCPTCVEAGYRLRGEPMPKGKWVVDGNGQRRWEWMK